MTDINMRRILKQPTLRMSSGGEGELLDDNDVRNFWPGQGAAPAVQVPQGVNMGRSQYLMRNPGALANQTASPSPGQLPFAHIPSTMTMPGQGAPARSFAGAGRGSINPAAVNPNAPAPATPDMQQVAGPRSSTAGGGRGGINPGIGGSAYPTTPGPMTTTATTAPVGFSPLRNNPGVLSDGKGGFGNAAGLAAAPSNYSGPTAGGTPGNPTASTHATMDALVAQQPGKQVADAKMAAVQRGQPISLREGGSPAIDHGHGGKVPGKGKGDKIPAKYEPGEFVVSNDMLKAKPGLRKQLHDLRGHVLAAKGMTPAEADAKAVTHKGLRAATGGLDDLWLNPRTNTYEPPAAGRQLAVVPQAAAPVQPGTALVTTADVGSNGAKVNWVPGNNAAPMYRETVTNRNVPPGGSAEAQAFRSSGAASNAPPAPAPITPKAAPSGGLLYQAGHKVGNIAAEVAANPKFQTAVKYGVPLAKAVGVGSAVYQGSKTADDIDAGNYAGAADHAGLATASLAGIGAGPLGAARAGWAGAAYLGGHAVGTHLIRKNMDDDQNDGVGYAVNETLRKAGNLVGQKWGVDDSAKLAIRDNGINATPADAEKYRTERTPAVTLRNSAPATAAAPQAAATLREQTDTNPGDTPEVMRQRKAERDALTQKDIALGDKMEATRLAREKAHWDAMDAPQRGELGYASHMARKSAMDLQQVQADTLRRGQDLQSADSRYGHELTFSANKGRMAWEMAKDNRDFGQKQNQQDFQQREEHDKSLTGKLESFYTTKDDKGNSVVDKDAVGATKAAVTAHLSSLIQAAQKRGDTATVNELRTKGTNAMGEDGLQRLITQLEAQRRAAGAHSAMNPWGGSYVESTNPSDYDVVGKESGVLQDQYVLRGGSKVPTRVLDYTRGGSAIAPNGMGDTPTTRFRNITNLGGNQ